jgi:GNAT superfamily N-acetyltransferase
LRAAGAFFNNHNQAMNTITIRQAQSADAPLLLSLINALAEYEKLPGPDSAACERLVRDGFGPAPRYQAYIAEQEGQAIGYALTFETYSSFLAQPALYLEDLFVLPDARRRGAGRALFRFLAAEALRRGCGRMEWAVLTWNQSAIDFYEQAGARRIDEWHVYRLSDDKLRILADLA